MKKKFLMVCLLIVGLGFLTGCKNDTIDKKDYHKYLVLESQFTYQNNWTNLGVDIQIPGANPSNKNVSYKVKIVAYDNNHKEISSTEATGVAFKNSHVTVKGHLSQGASFDGPIINYEITELKLSENE